MVLPAGFYIIWDAYFTATGVWSFNETYVTGINFIGLPLEEILFFFVVPYCCVFIYECIKCYFPETNFKYSDIFLKFLAFCLLVSGLIFFEQEYTSYTMLLLGVTIIAFYFFKNHFKTFNTSIFLLSYIVILLPFLIVNGFLTAIPVVEYNDHANLGIRIYTIPFEDVFYGMLLIFLNIVIFEKLRSWRNQEKI